MNPTVNIAEAKSKLSELIDQLEPGQELTICKRNVPGAKLIKSTIFESHASKVLMDTNACLSL